MTQHETPTSRAHLKARIRGRWTPEQLTFIRQLAKSHGVTAGEVLRHIAAWYLSQQGPTPTPPENPEPSSAFLKKRETGLTVMDFLTTTGQAEVIKRAARELGEAAWLRRAVDAYKRGGPLAHQEQ